MPLIDSAFKGNKFHLNGHLETILPFLFRRVTVAYRRQRIELPDGDFIDLDRVGSGNSKLLVLFHGLEGSSQSQYIKGFAKYFSARGYDVCVVNFRSCSGEINRLLTSYHSGSTADIHEALQLLTADRAYEACYLCGFSLGGNVLLKYLGDGQYTPPSAVKAAAAFSVPIDLAGGAAQLARLANKLYMLRFLRSMNRKMVQKASRFPGKLDIKDIGRIKTFEEWDNRFTAPIHGFASAADYYRQCHSRQFLPGVELPTLLVNAKNDPFLSAGCYLDNDAEAGAAVYFEAPERGGHVGFMNDLPNGAYYSEERAYAFFEQYN
jgi:predicted alpha/beta-fold hydrolase